MDDVPVENLSEEEAKAELASLARRLARANYDYYTRNDPDLDDSEYDRLKWRNREIEKHYPHLIRPDSPISQIGGPISESFDKVNHTVRMLSLDNAFSEDDVRIFDTRIRNFLGLTESDSLEYVAEPKIDGLSLSLRYDRRSSGPGLNTWKRGSRRRRDQKRVQNRWHSGDTKSERTRHSGGPR